MRSKKQNHPFVLNFIVLATYVIATILMTFPAIKDIGTRIDLGDPMLNAWIMASNFHALVTNPLTIFETNIFFPLTGTLAFSDPIITPVLLFSPLFAGVDNVILLHNVVLLSNYVFAAFFAYLLAYEIHHCWKSAYLAGFVYAFCHFSLSHIHWVQLAPQWLPFTLLFLIRYRNTSSISSLCFFCLGILFQLYTGLYHFIYLFLALGIFFIFFSGDFLQITRSKKRYFIGLLIGGLVTLLMASPLMYTYIHTHDKYELGRTLNDLLVGGARWQDYLMPLKGSIFSSFYQYFFTIPTLYWEKSLFPGVVALLFTLVSLFTLGVRGTRRKKEVFLTDGYLLFFLFMGLFFLFLSFGPNRNGSLSWFSIFSGWVPGLLGIRVPARAGVMVMLSIAILSSFGFAIVLQWFNRWRGIQFSIFVLCILFVGGEYWVPINRVGKNPYQVENNIPEVYRWISENVNDEALIELPLSNVGDETRRMYYSTYHWKKRVNGYSGYPSPFIGKLNRAGIVELSEDSVELLREVGVRYVIIDKRKFGRSRDEIQRQGLTLCWENGNYLVFDAL